MCCAPRGFGSAGDSLNNEYQPIFRARAYDMELCLKNELFEI
jgi:hypothetical protein